MRFGAFARGAGASGFGFPRGNGLGRSERGARCVRARGGAGGVIEAIESKPLLKSALVCAGLGCVGDTVAQRREAGERARSAATAKGKAGKGKQPPGASDAHDFQRTLKQALYNFFFYGPVQHHWYIALAAKFPAKAFALTAESLAPFGAKVFLNQAVLGPLVVTTFFLWGAVWSGDVSNYPAKVRRDALPTLRAGWSFWVPASSVNFALVPTRHQVLYMSACSIVWNVILSLNLNK